MNEPGQPVNVHMQPPMMMEPPGIHEMQHEAPGEHPLLPPPHPEGLLPPPGFVGPPGTQGWAPEEFGDGRGVPNPNMPPQGPPLVQQQNMNEKQLPSLLSLKVDPPEQLMEGSGTAEVVFPQVLEQVLPLKNQRALELGTDEAGNENSAATATVPGEQEKDVSMPLWERDENTDVGLRESDNTAKQNRDIKISKNKKKKKRKKNRKNMEGNKNSHASLRLLRTDAANSEPRAQNC